LFQVYPDYAKCTRLQFVATLAFIPCGKRLQHLFIF